MTELGQALAFVIVISFALFWANPQGVTQAVADLVGVFKGGCLDG